MIEVKQTKREKIYLGGYEMWLDKSRGASLVIYDKENSKNGLCVDVMGTHPNIWIFSDDLTKSEKQELINYLKNGK